MPRLALAELGLDKLGGATRLHVLLEALAKLAVERLVAPEPARLQERRADGDVVLGEANALVHRARRVADLEAHVPQQVENLLHHLLAARRQLVGQQEQQVDVRSEEHTSELQSLMRISYAVFC